MSRPSPPGFVWKALSTWWGRKPGLGLRLSLYLTNSIKVLRRGRFHLLALRPLTMPNWAPRPLLPQTKTALSSRLQSLTRLFRAPLLSPLNTAVISFYRASGCRCLSATSRKESALSGKSKQTAHRQSARSPHCQITYRVASSTVGGPERVPASARFQDTSNFFHHLSCPEIKWPARLIRREKLRP